MHYLKGLISSMQGHGQVNVPNIIIDCNPCSSAKKTCRCQTVATVDRNRQKHNFKCVKNNVFVKPDEQ